MNSIQYEELCRLFLAEQLGIDIQQVKTREIPSPTLRGKPELEHQIDLYWETTDAVASYFNIANAKWRTKDKVDQPDVMLLQAVKTELKAHKCVMLTNTGFTDGARSMAENNGIALHIIEPDFNYNSLENRDRVIIQSNLRRLSSGGQTPLYQHQVIYKAFDIERPRIIAPAGIPGAPPATRTGNGIIGQITDKAIRPQGSREQRGGNLKTGGVMPPGFERK